MNNKTCSKYKEEFKIALRTLKDRMRDKEFATDVYRALCNVRWRKFCTDYHYSCSWRYAGGLVAEIREVDENYLDFFYSGGEGFVNIEIEHLLNDLGWLPIPWAEREDFSLEDKGSAFLHEGEVNDKISNN